MDIEVNDPELAAKLKRLDAGTAQAAPGFDYQGLLDRHGLRQARARRRLAVARGAAVALFVALLGASFWRLDENTGAPPVAQGTPEVESPHGIEPRIVRADTYLAVAALEDHIASIDDALNVARVYSPRGDEVARLERARAELLDSYAQVRYAQLVSANF
jgi:hypothetical protein